VLVRQAGYFDVSELELPHQTLENYQAPGPLHSVVVEMSVSGKDDIDPDRRKLSSEPLRVMTRRIIPPGIGQNGQTIRRCDLEGIVAIKLDLDVAPTSWVSPLFLNSDESIVIPRR
jgi:hypothetical protein